MSNVKIIPLGGVRENSKSLYVVEVDAQIFVLDCGLMFPEGELYGIDAVIPDFTYLKQNKERIAGVFLSHGHEDAIGALPYFIDEFNVPVFGSELTIELARLQVESVIGKGNFSDYHVVDSSLAIDFGEVKVHFFQVTHTIPDAMGISIETPEGHVVYTGNFKFDQSADGPYRTNLNHISDIGKERVLVLLSSSLGAESLEENAPDKRVQSVVTEIFQDAPTRIIVAAVQSNLLRIQQIINAAHATNRKVFISSSKSQDIINVAIDLGKLTLPKKDILQSISDLEKFHDDETVILETGSSGEPIKALREMATNQHPNIGIRNEDTVFIATNPSVAMEVEVAECENLIYRSGGEVVKLSNQIKASGHATPNDLQLMMNLLHPEYFIPVQGEYRVLAAHARLAHETGIPHEHIFTLSNGDVVEYKKGKMHSTGTVPADNTLVDGIGIGDVGNIVLRDRRLLSNDGIFVAVVTIDRRKQTIVAKPHIVTRGFVFVKANYDLINESTTIVEKVIQQNLKHNDFDWGSIKSEIRNELSDYLFKETKRRPIILPVIMEVNQRRWYDK